MWDTFERTLPMSTYVVGYIVTDMPHRMADPALSETRFRGERIGEGRGSWDNENNAVGNLPLQATRLFCIGLKFVWFCFLHLIIITNITQFIK